MSSMSVQAGLKAQKGFSRAGAVQRMLQLMHRHLIDQLLIQVRACSQ